MNLLGWMRRFLPRMGEASNDTMRHLKRMWMYMPTIHWWNGRINIGVELELVQYEGKPCEPRPVQSFIFGLVIFPWKWKFGQEHMYYDGPHCMYDLGPFSLYKSWNWCTKCMPEDSC